MPKSFTPEQAHAAIVDMDTQSDRGAGIMIGAYLEYLLENCIAYKFVAISNTMYDSIFENTAPLATFSAKIDIGFCLGLYGEQTRRCLHLIRKIRNEFAHSEIPRDFNSPEIKKFCDVLPTPGDAPSYPPERYNRQKYYTVAMSIGTYLAVIGNEDQRPKYSGLP